MGKKKNQKKKNEKKSSYKKIRKKSYKKSAPKISSVGQMCDTRTHGLNEEDKKGSPGV